MAMTRGTGLSLPNPGPDPDIDLKPSPTPPLLALLTSSQLRERIRLALGLGAASRIIGPVSHAAGWPDLCTLAARNPGSPALIDTFRGNGNPIAAGSRAACNGQLALTPVICYTRLDPVRERQLNRTGITFAAHLLPGVDDELEVIDAAILRSIDMQCVRRLRQRILRAAHPAAAEIMGYVLDLAIAPRAVHDIALRIGRTERTLQRRCSILGIPSPKRLLSLARIFTVQRLAEWSRQPYGAVAVALGYSDHSNYRRLVRGVFGRTPVEMERCGGHRYVAEAIVESLA